MQELRKLCGPLSASARRRHRVDLKSARALSILGCVTRRSRRAMRWWLVGGRAMLGGVRVERRSRRGTL